MENSKGGVGSEDSQYKDKELKKVSSSNKIKYLVISGPKGEKNQVIFEGIKPDKFRNFIFLTKSGKYKLVALVVTLVMLLLWASVVQLTNFNAKTISMLAKKFHNTPLSSPPERVYQNNGYLLVSSNGGLNQMRSGICDMVTIARYLNVTLIAPQLDNTSFWNDLSQFDDIFDVDYFINSLKGEVRIVKELPSSMKKKVEEESLYSMPPISWSNMSYYYDVILPRFKTYGVVHFQKTDARLANNGVPKDVQKLRCRVNYESLRFTPEIEQLAKKIVKILREKGPFLVLHLRYEMDMIAFSGCNEGCNPQEVDDLTKMRYAYPWWKEKEIDGEAKRKAGQCPLTPEETALILSALGIDQNIQVYIAAGDIYGGERRLSNLRQSYPNLVKKETLLPPEDLVPFQNHSNQMAALDYYVAIHSDIFVPTYGGNMAKVVEGHRRYLGYKKTVGLDRKMLVGLIDEYRAGNLSWVEFAVLVKKSHEGRWGGPTERVKIPGKPKEEDYFYTNPEECLPQ